MSTTIEQVDEQIDHLDFDVCAAPASQSHDCTVTPVGVVSYCKGDYRVCQTIVNYATRVLTRYPNGRCADCERLIKNCWSIVPL